MNEGKRAEYFRNTMYADQDALPIDVYWSIFKPHKFGIGMPMGEYCWFCKHSLFYHIKHDIDLETARGAE